MTVQTNPTPGLAPSSSLQVGQGLALPLDVVTRATGIVGQRGTGKTSTAVVLVEEAAAAGAHFAVVDPTGAWYGLRSSADGDGPGLDCVVLGGWNGDVPLEPTSGELVARLAVEEAYNVVLDLERMTKGEQVRFVADFSEAVYHLCRSALLVVYDEAHRFAPQALRDPGGYGARCLGAVADVVTLGRRKGLGAALVSQRAAKIHKDAFEQVEIMVVHRLMGPNDRKAIAGWLEEASDNPRAGLDAIPRLERGTAVVYAPSYDVSGVYEIRPKQTFDSSATPEVGGQVVLPKGRADIDMAALEARMADTLERQREEDPKTLRERVHKLKADLAQARAGGAAERAAVELKAERERVAALENEIERLSSIADAGRNLHHRVRLIASHHAGPLHQLADALTDLDAPIETHAAVRVTGDAPSEPVENRTRTAARSRPETDRSLDRETGRDSRTSAPPADGSDDPEGVAQTASTSPPLKAGAIRMLAALLDAPQPLTRAELATIANVRKGGTMSDYLSALRRRGVLQEDGGVVGLRDVEQATLLSAHASRQDRSPQDIVAPHLPRLKAGARRMLEHLMRAYPDGYTRAELSRLADVSKGGTFSDYLSSLKTRGLAQERAKRVYAGAVLYLWDDQTQ